MAFIGKNAVAQSPNKDRLPTVRESLGPLNSRPEFKGMVKTAETKLRSGNVPGTLAAAKKTEAPKRKKRRSTILTSSLGAPEDGRITRSKLGSLG